MKDLDTLAAVVVLGLIGLATALPPWTAPAASVAHDIAIGLIGFLAKAVVTANPTQPPQGPNP